MICFQETAEGGFGDRLRGIACLLHFADKWGEHEVFYNDDSYQITPGKRFSHFPARMPDLIRIEGLSFRYHKLPMPQAGHTIVYDSTTLKKLQIRRGFRHMSRLRPRDEAVTERVRALGLNQDWIGLHIRCTDNINERNRIRNGDYDVGRKRLALKRIKKLARRYPARKVYIAADNYRALRYWSLLLRNAGFTVQSNTSEFDQGKLRQTSNFDMLVDFFALAACGRIVRVMPSEFSRFAAWIGGRPLRYQQLW